MGTLALNRPINRMPSLFDDFFRPWDGFFDEGNLWERALNIPAVNITQNKKDFLVSMAVPGMKKDDFKIDVNGNLLTISTEKEESKEEKDKMYTRKEYNFSCFSRSFTLPEEVNKEKIEAKYDEGILRISLPFKEGAKLLTGKHISVK